MVTHSLFEEMLQFLKFLKFSSFFFVSRWLYSSYQVRLLCCFCCFCSSFQFCNFQALLLLYIFEVVQVIWSSKLSTTDTVLFRKLEKLYKYSNQFTSHYHIVFFDGFFAKTSSTLNTASTLIVHIFKNYFSFYEFFCSYYFTLN